MPLRSAFHGLMAREDINFLVTNRIPRILATRFMGWFSRIEQPWVRDVSLWLWRHFADLRLEEAKQTHFPSMHACFIRELKPGARPVEPAPQLLASPCDAIIGAHGQVDGVQLIQAKGYPYTLHELLGDDALVERCRGGTYVTLRITSSMYHRFHAPHDCSVDEVNYISGDAWNVNPVALKRVEKLFCRNERAVINARLQSVGKGGSGGQAVTMVAVAAVLVASIRLHCIDKLLHLRYRGPNRIACNARYAKGDEMGWFQHGSTIIMFAPAGCTLCPELAEGVIVRAGQALLRLPEQAT